MDEPGSEAVTETGDSVNAPTCSELFRTAVERVFRCGAIGRALATVFIRSVDPAVSIVQRVATMVGLPEAAKSARDFRLGWREWFETKICTMADERLRQSVGTLRSLYRGSGCHLPSEESLVEQVVESLGGDGFFLAEMAELQRLPVSDIALRRRLMALDRAVAGHMAVIAQASVAESGIVDPVFWIVGA